MDQLKKYIPILRTKQGEFSALKKIDPVLRTEFTPMFEFRPMGLSERKRNLSLETYLGNACRNLLEGWPAEEFCLIDIYGIPHATKVKEGFSPLGFILDKLATGGLNFIPTIGLDREHEYKVELQNFLKLFPPAKLCLRLGRADLELPQKTAADISALLNDLNLTKERIHLLIDLRFIHEDSIDEHVDLISTLANEVEIESWLTFTVSGSSIPEDVSKMKIGEPNLIRRKEFELWSTLVESAAMIGRVPRYSDYTIVHPDKADAFVPPNKISTKIRYTTDDCWLVWRGKRHEKSDTKRVEYQELAQNITRHTCYKGKDFSWGDLTVFECAQKRNQFCAPAKWVEIDINHHLSFVTHQIASSSAFA